MEDSYPINHHVLAEDFQQKSQGREEFTQEDAMWLYEALTTMCNAYDELLDKMEES